MEDDDLVFSLEDVDYTGEQVDSCNEIYKKYFGLNLQIKLFDQRLDQLVKGCSERDVNPNMTFSSTKAVEDLKTAQEKMKKSLLKLLISSFESKCRPVDIRSLEGSILEEEVYTWLRKSNIEELKFLKKNIEKFTRFVDKMNMNAREVEKELDRIPENLQLATRNLGQSADRKTQIRDQQQGSNPSSNKGGMEKSLIDVVVSMYGFPPDAALDIEKSLLDRKLVSEAFKIKNSSTFPLVLDDPNRQNDEIDPMAFLDAEKVSEKCEPEYAETQNWKLFNKAKKNFEDKVKDLLGEDKQNVADNYETKEILKATTEFMFHMETILCELVHIFYRMMSGYEPAATGFQNLNSVLKESMEQQKGMVPIIVYTVLAMLQIPCQGEEGDKEAMYKEIEFSEVINTFQRVFLLLTVALKDITSHAQAILNMRVVIACQTILGEAENLMNQIALKIYGVKSRLDTKKKEDDEQSSSPAVPVTQPNTEGKELARESKRQKMI